MGCFSFSTLVSSRALWDVGRQVGNWRVNLDSCNFTIHPSTSSHPYFCAWSTPLTFPHLISCNHLFGLLGFTLFLCNLLCAAESKRWLLHNKSHLSFPSKDSSDLNRNQVLNCHLPISFHLCCSHPRLLCCSSYDLSKTSQNKTNTKKTGRLSHISHKIPFWSTQLGCFHCASRAVYTEPLFNPDARYPEKEPLGLGL